MSISIKREARRSSQRTADVEANVGVQYPHPCTLTLPLNVPEEADLKTRPHSLHQQSFSFCLLLWDHAERLRGQTPAGLDVIGLPSALRSIWRPLWSNWSEDYTGHSVTLCVFISLILTLILKVSLFTRWSQ